MFRIGPGLGTLQSMAPDVINNLHAIYKTQTEKIAAANLEAEATVQKAAEAAQAAPRPTKGVETVSKKTTRKTRKKN